mgnify:CR=1 FL=1
MSEMAKLPVYLFRRGPRGTFHFRRLIQPELRDLLGDTILAEFRGRLATPTPPDGG